MAQILSPLYPTMVGRLRLMKEIEKLEVCGDSMHWRVLLRIMSAYLMMSIQFVRITWDFLEKLGKTGLPVHVYSFMVRRIVGSYFKEPQLSIMFISPSCHFPMYTYSMGGSDAEGMNSVYYFQEKKRNWRNTWRDWRDINRNYHWKNDLDKQCNII